MTHMRLRRSRVVGAALLSLVVFGTACSSPERRAALEDRLRYVDPFIGTDDSDSPFPVPGGAGGSTHPGAVVPFGMIQLSPDTPTASPSGYRYSDTQIEQFSVTHFNGAGCPNNEDLPFLPIVGAVTTSPGADWAAFRTGYAKGSEAASPGYYHVTLDSGIEVELTATTRTGMARLHYPATASAELLLHAGKSATGDRDGSVEIVGRDRIRGSATAGGFCWSSQTFSIYFAAQFDRPFEESGTWLGSALTPGATAASGVGAGAFVTFDTTDDVPVQMKIAVSFVSMENAEANLAAENANWDFDATRAAASTRWNEALNRIEVSGGSDADMEKFYTALYHVFQNPNVASDVNGEYEGFDHVVHKADGWTVYQNYSGWDIIRSWTHLVSAIAPEAPDIIRSMVEDGVQGGLLPFWTHENVETRVMVGDPGTVNVANAFAMGVRGFDADAALALMLESATNPNHTQRVNLQDWIQLHYAGNAAISLEYAMADFAISRFADALGKTATRDEYLARSHQWQDSWNATDELIEPRVVDPANPAGVGAWDCQPLDVSSVCGFIEGNAAQYVWMVPHDLEGLFTRMGGHAKAIARLDDLFTELNAGTQRPHFYIGNEPEHGTPWAYNFAGAPWKTQAVTGRILDEEFSGNPGGLPGNDDLGATSAWAVWAYIGMYPAIPGTDVLVLHGPRFPSIKLHLANGRTVAIAGEGAGAGAQYVQSLAAYGQPTSKNWLRFADIADGASLHFRMGSMPNEGWGSGAEDVPPSFFP